MRESTRAAASTRQAAMAASPSEAEDFRRVFDLFHRQVLSYCTRRAEAAEAQDAAAEVFLVAWRRRLTHPLDRVDLPWLYATARRTLANQRRTRTRQRRLGEKLARQPRVSVRTPEDVALINDETGRVRVALDSLREADREVIRLALWEGLGHAEIGEVLGTSSRAASMRLSRAIARLEARLSDSMIVIGGDR
jgi:RNA polymerase sigma factor (sigma-70 family)